MFRKKLLDNDSQKFYLIHIKYKLNLDTFKDVYNKIKDYIEYYNNYKYQ